MIAPALLASTAIILLSFVSEDAATISSALSIFGGPLSWPLGFVSCFAGIWLGDLGLYSLARYAGKNVLRSRWLARLTDPVTITRCEKTFAHNSALASQCDVDGPKNSHDVDPAPNHQRSATRHTLGVLAGVVVLYSCCPLLFLARRSLPQFEPAHSSQSGNGDGRIRR